MARGPIVRKLGRHLSRRRLCQWGLASAGRIGTFAPLALALPACSPMSPTPGPNPAPDSEARTKADKAIDAAFEYAFPLYEMARTRYGALESPANPVRATANVPGHRRTLSDHRARAVTTPNNDTLYSSCWIDLSAGPVQVMVSRLPAGRYWSVALMDFFTNHIAMLGSRLDGVGPVAVTLVGPQWRGNRPAGRVIDCPGEDVWLLGRWLVDGPHDLASGRAMQDALQVQAHAPATPLPRVAPRSSADAENFLAVVNQALMRNPAPAQDAALMAALTAVGLRPGMTDTWAALPDTLRQTWQQRIAPAHDRLKLGLGHSQRTVQGWRLPPASIGNFGNDHTLRAAVALGGLAALEPVEAVYFSRTDDADGQPLDGSHRYRIQVPAGGLPLDGFWSLSVYERLPDGRLFFTENPIQRFAVGDRTPGLQANADGSIDLWLQRDAPTSPGQRSNWLPAAPGPMQLSLRAYLPRPALRDGLAPLPSLTRQA